MGSEMCIRDRQATVSIGVASLDTRDKQDSTAVAQQLLAKADLALYQAKKEGRNKVISAG